MSLILDLLFPRLCLGCGQKGGYFCTSCLNKQFTNSPVCTTKNPLIEGHFSLYKYNDLIKKIITEIKYGFVTDIIDSFTDTSASIIKTNFSHLLTYWQKNNFVLVPIPLHYYRQNWRGFNQSVLIGKLLAQKLNLKYSDQLLIRSKNTHVQAKIHSKLAKRSNLNGAFSCIDPLLIPSNIILFDDVSTTFSTLNSAFQTLSKDGSPFHCWFLTLSGK